MTNDEKLLKIKAIVQEVCNGNCNSATMLCDGCCDNFLNDLCEILEIEEVEDENN